MNRRTVGLPELSTFVAHEARLIDEQQYDQWLALFASDGHYWVPLRSDQTDPELSPSLAYEDRLLLKIRIDRLQHPQAHSQQPPSRCLHVMQSSALIDQAPDAWQVSTPFHYTEQRGDHVSQLSGVARHHLIWQDDAIRILEKRVDLLGADRPLPMIQLFP